MGDRLRHRPTQLPARPVRPPFSTSSAMRKPSPGGPIRFSAGTEVSSKNSGTVELPVNANGQPLTYLCGHSLGLANPFAEGFHNAGDGANRLMDSGRDRPFLERAILQGFGPVVFCDDEYAYLRMILPTTAPADDMPRPGCF